MAASNLPGGRGQGLIRRGEGWGKGESPLQLGMECCTMLTESMKGAQVGGGGGKQRVGDGRVGKPEED